MDRIIRSGIEAFGELRAARSSFVNSRSIVAMSVEVTAATRFQRPF